MADTPRDYNQWVKSVERRLKEALRAGQSPQAVRLARDLHEVRGEVADNARVPAAPVELVTETRVLPDLTGAPRGEVSVSFAPVTVDVNANPIEVDRYELWLETVEPEAEEEEEPGDGDFGWEEDDSWRTNLVTDTESEYWRSRNTPRTKQVADLWEGEDFVAGDRIRFSVTVDTFGVNPRPGDFERLMHSVRMSAFNARSVEDDVWQMTILPTSNEGDTSDRTVETYTLEGEVPEGTTRITAHYAGTIRAGHIEFINPVLFNLSETKPEPPETQASKMVSTSFEPRLSFSPLEVGGQYELRVRAIAGTRAGPMSVSRRVTIEADRTPPPIPSALELSSSGATVMASWDLLAGTGDPMPSDFSHTEVAYGYLPPPTEVAGSITLLFSQYIFETPQQPSDVDFDGTWYFRHRAVDTSGNKSPWSATSSIVPKQLVDTASLQFEIDALNRERIDPLQERINQGLFDAAADLKDFRDEWEEEWDEGRLKEMQDRQGTLESDLAEGFRKAEGALQEFRDEWNENWDPEEMGLLKDRHLALEGDLQRGLTDVYAEAQAYAESQASNAVNQAASNAQTEYDRLQAAADEALNAAIFGGGNLYPDPSFEMGGKGLGSWSRGEIVQDSRARHGNHVLRVTSTGGSMAMPLERVSVGHDSWAYLELWFMRTSTSQTGSIAMRLQAENQDGGATHWSVGTTSIDDAPLNEWIKVSGVRLATHSTAPRVGWRAYPYVTGGDPAGVLIDSVKHLDVTHAHEALQAAQTAQQTAEAAHVEAGNARDLAVTAQDTAAGKADIIRSTSAPTGTAPEGSIWFRYNNMTANRRLIGWWVRESGAWRSQEMDETILPQVNIGTGTYGDLDGDRLTANTVRAGALSVVPDGRDLAPDLVDYSDLWTLGSQVSIEPSVAAESGLSLRVAGDGSSSTGAGRAYGPWIPVREGDTIYYKVSLGYYSRTPDGALRIYFMYNGSVTSWTRLHSATSTGTYEGHFTVPRDGTTKMAFGVTVDTPATNGGDWAVRDFDVRVATKGVHITPQGIKSPQVDTAELTASAAFLDHAMVNLIQGRMANFDEAIIGGALLKDNSVTVNKLSVIPNVTDYAPDPGEFPELWDLVGASIVPSTGADDNPSNVGFQFNQRSGNTQVRGPVRPVTPGKQIRFRGRYTGWGSGTSGATVQVRMEWSGDLSSGRDGFATFVSISTSASLGWYSGTVTVPEWAEYGRLYFYQASNSGRDMGFRGSIQCEPMVGSVLIEDGAIKAQHGDFADITASAAFLDHAMVNLIQGRMANFDQALIGGNLLKDASISTRHLTIGNTEELWNNSWMDDLEDTAYIFSPNGAVGSSAFRNRFHQENPSSLASSSFDWRYTTLQGDRGIQIWPVNSTLNQRAAFRLGPGKGILVRPGEQYTFRARIRDQNDGNFFDLRMALFDYESGDGVPQADCPRFNMRGIVHGASGESVWTFVIPDNYPRMWMVPSIHSGNNSSSGARSVLRPQLFKSADGRMIVDGLLRASTAELQELFFDTAVGNSIAAGAGRFLTIETGNLASNAVTADKISFGSLNGALITGLQIQTHTNNRGVKITSAGIRAFNSSGTEVFTVNASNGSVTARSGTFTASSFDGGTVTGSTITGAEFRTASSIFGSSNGGVRITGNASEGGLIQITNSNANSVFTAGRTGLSLRGDITADNVALAGELRVGVGGAGEGGLTPVGDRLDIRGRVPELDNMSGETTFMAMTTPYSLAEEWYENFHSGQLKLVRITYPKSAPRGARLPLIIMNINSRNVPGRGASGGVTRNRTNAYFNLALGYTDTITTGYNPSMAVTILSTWGQTTPGGFVGT